ncbi:hypothetical protein MRB53_028847 [Persea americana]|uniref:Uncharacterized protein n=1 Tax=Persea americana TaxID=3435 RepID=A0ACC2KGV9_PERAE|nr:hypothetical protein MRB53_028847 [Persea americana]
MSNLGEVLRICHCPIQYPENVEDSGRLVKEDNKNRELGSRFTQCYPRCYVGLEEDEKEVDTLEEDGGAFKRDVGKDGGVQFFGALEW